MQTIGGDNDYVKVPAVRRRNRPVSSPPDAMPLPVAPQPAPTPTENTPAPELPAAEPSPAEPIVYETLRPDATVGSDVPPENPYLVPAVKPEQAARPVDLSDLLADQQLNAAVASSGTPDHLALESLQQYDDAVAACVLISVNSAEPLVSPPQSSAQEVFYTNLVGVDPRASLPISEASLQRGLTTDSTGVSRSVSDDLHRPSLPVSMSSTGSSGLSPCSPPNAHQPPNAAVRLPSYEESISSDISGMNMSPITSPLLLSGEPTPEASALPGLESPPAYVSDRLLELNANSPLKSRQVQQLQQEMASAAGIRVQLDKTQCRQAVALVDCYDRVWLVLVIPRGH